ncbi:MAG: C45 family peptidase [Pseudomonadota bacterium]
MRSSDMPILELSGAPYERGVQHGNQLREAIQSTLALQDKQLTGEHGNAEREKRQFLEQCSFEAAITQWAPSLMAELQGIADGAEVAFDDIYFLNLGDEHWSYRAEQTAAATGETCTCFGVTDAVSAHGTVTLSGQNMDVGQWLEGMQTLFRIRPYPAGATALVFGHPGGIGLNGLNTASLGIACNSLLTLRAARTGLPVAFVMRRFLEHTDFDEACAFLRDAPHASGQNYLVSAPGCVRSFECAAGAVVEYQPTEDCSRVCHTNHPLVNQNTNSVVRAAAAQASTHARMASIYARLGRTGVEVSLSAVKAALSAHDDPQCPVSRLGDYGDALIGYTLASSIYELGDTPKLHIAAGPPCQTDWREVDVLGDNRA